MPNKIRVITEARVIEKAQRIWYFPWTFLNFPYWVVIENIKSKRTCDSELFVTVFFATRYAKSVAKKLGVKPDLSFKEYLRGD